MPRALISAIVLAVCGLMCEALPGTWAAGQDPGVSAHGITLGGVIDQTGKGTLISKPILGGYELAVKEINARGGINGRKVAYSALSDNYDPSQTLPLVKELVESDRVFAVMGVFGSDDANVALPYLERNHVPFFDPIGGGADVLHKHWVWQTEPDYAREGRVMARYVTSSLHAKRVGVLYQVGVGEPQRDALKAALPSLHASLVATASYESTDTNLQGQVLRLKSANPDVVILNGIPTATAAFMSYARLLAFHPQSGFLASYPMGDPLWLGLVGPSAEGNRVTSYADLTGRNKVASAYRAAIRKYGGEKYSNYGLYGYFNATLFFSALKQVGKKPTRARLQHVLDYKYRRYKTGFTGNLNWTPSQHYGARQFKVYQIRDGKFLPVTGWLNP